MESSLYYENPQELRQLLNNYFVRINPLDKIYYKKCLSNVRDSVLLEWMSRPKLEDRFNLYPQKFRCLIHAIIMSARSLTKTREVDDETFNKIEFLSDARLSSPEIFVKSPNRSLKYTFPDTEEEIRMYLNDIISSEVDNMITDDQCLGNYYAYLGDSKEAVAAGIISDCFLAPHVSSLIDSTTAFELVFGMLVLSSVRDLINSTLINNADMYYCDKYLFLTEVYKNVSDYDIKPFIVLLTGMRKFNIIK